MSDDGYDDILNRTWDEMPTEKVVPDGSYVLRGQNVTYMKAKEGVSPRVLFFYRPVEAMADVDESELAALGDYDIQNTQVVKQFWAERPRDWDAIRAHLRLHGVDTDSGTLKDQFKDFKNTEIVGYLEQRSFESNGQTRTQNEVTAFSALES